MAIALWAWQGRGGLPSSCPSLQWPYGCPWDRPHTECAARLAMAGQLLPSQGLLLGVRRNIHRAAAPGSSHAAGLVSHQRPAYVWPAACQYKPKMSSRAGHGSASAVGLRDAICLDIHWLTSRAVASRLLRSTFSGVHACCLLPFMTGCKPQPSLAVWIGDSIAGAGISSILQVLYDTLCKEGTGPAAKPT